MKKYRVAVVLLLMSGFLSACMNPRGLPDYTASGALAGAATGAAIGSTTSRSPAGALIGAAVGAVAGGAVGHDMDRQQEQWLDRQARVFSLGDIKNLAAAGLSDDIIVSQIRNSRAVYRLSSNDIIDLKNAGVSEQVIDYMINTPDLLVSDGPGVAVEPMYIAPSPGFIWIGGTWVWRGVHRRYHDGYWGGPHPEHYDFRH